MINYDYYDEEYCGSVYVLVVYKGFKKAYVDHVNLSEDMVYYTTDCCEAGAFFPYERAVEIADAIRRIRGVTKVKIYDKDKDDWIF